MSKDNLKGLITAALAVNTEGVSVAKRAGVVAEALIAASGGPDHLVRVENEDWRVTVQHPLIERFGDEEDHTLFECEEGEQIMNHLERAFYTGTELADGLYRARYHKRSGIYLEKVQ